MFLKINYLNNEESYTFDNNDWSYNINYFLRDNEALCSLNIINEEHNIIQNLDLINLYQFINNNLNNISNIILFNDNQTLIFDMVQLLLNIKKIKLKYININRELTDGEMIEKGILFQLIFNLQGNNNG